MIKFLFILSVIAFVALLNAGCGVDFTTGESCLRDKDCENGYICSDDGLCIKNSDGDSVDGDKADGDNIDGDKVDGDKVDGDVIDGDKVDGDSSDGDVVDGDNTDGDVVTSVCVSNDGYCSEWNFSGL